MNLYLVFVYELIPSGEPDSEEPGSSEKPADLDTKVERVRKKRSMFEKAASADQPAPSNFGKKVTLVI